MNLSKDTYLGMCPSCLTEKFDQRNISEQRQLSAELEPSQLNATHC